MSSNQQSQPPEESSKMDALVKVVLVFFISLLSFSVGTFVGKQVSDSDHRRASLEGESTTREVASTEPEEHAADEDAVADTAVEDLASEFLQDSELPKANVVDEDGYSSYDRNQVAKGTPTEKPVPIQKPNEPPTVKTGETAQTSPTGRPTPIQKPNEPPRNAPLEAAKKVSQGEAPTSGKIAEGPRKPSSTLPAASSGLGKYTVQVASYGAEDEAKKHASQLKNKGWNAFYIPAEIKGQTWFRVSVGLFEESNNAQAFKAQFLKESGAKNALVVKIVQ